MVLKRNNVNLDNIIIPKYDFQTYTIVTPTNKVQVVDESGKVLNDYDLKNTIYTDLVMKYYNSDDYLFYGTSHDAGSKNYNVFGTYDTKTKEISYTETFRNSLNRTNFKVKEVPLYMETIDPDRYRMYGLYDTDYLYDYKLNKGVRINEKTGMARKYFPLTETTGFLTSGGLTVYFIDFEKQTAKSNGHREYSTLYSCGIYDNKLLVYGVTDEGIYRFLLIDEDFNYTIVCDNTNITDKTNLSDDDYSHLYTMCFIKEDIVLLNLTKRNQDENSMYDTMTSFIDLSKDTPELVNLSSLENNGKGVYVVLYADEENVYLYSCIEPKKSEFIILDVNTLEVVKTIPIDKGLIKMPQFDIPLILKN